jgi:broad specificity phosphatase PhoE
MPKILLTRHGHVEGISPERFRCQTELVLTDKGQAQAAALAERISREWTPSAIYTSPLQRCVATAETIGKATRAPCRVLKSLIDLNYGAWQWQEVRSHSPALFALWHFAPHLVRFPGRILSGFPKVTPCRTCARAADTIRLALERHHNETVVLVGHESVNRAILLQTLDQPLSAYWRLTQDPLEVTHSHSRVLRFNDTGHLANIFES